MSRTKVNSLVSLHERPSGGEVNGHRAAGLVIDSDLVLVPQPPAWLVDSPTDVAAFVVPIPTRDGATITEVTPRRLAVLGVERPGRPDPVLAYIQTSERIPFPALDLDAAARADWQRALETGADHWQALIDTGAVPPEARNGIPSALARRAGGARATATREPVSRTTHTYPTRAALAADCRLPSCWPKDAASSRLFGD